MTFILTFPFLNVNLITSTIIDIFNIKNNSIFLIFFIYFLWINLIYLFWFFVWNKLKKYDNLKVYIIALNIPIFSILFYWIFCKKLSFKNFIFLYIFTLIPYLFLTIQEKLNIEFNTYYIWIFYYLFVIIYFLLINLIPKKAN